MKFTLVLAKTFALSILCLLWSCQAEDVNPGQSEVSKVKTFADSQSHQVIEPECSPRVAYPLMDLNGGTNVSYFGPFGNPTNPPTPWGSVTLVNSDEDLALEIDLAYGWYVDWVQTYIGDDSAMAITNGIPVVDNSWLVNDVDPMVNSTEIWVPLSSLQSADVDWSMRLSIVRMDFFQGIDQGSRTEVWAYNSAWNDPNMPAQNSPCFAICGWDVATCPTTGQRAPATIQ